VTKIEAVRTLIADARSQRVSTAAAKRVVSACKALGLERKDEIISVLASLEYCDGETGEPWTVKRVWP
jgi:hypothetical protein